MKKTIAYIGAVVAIGLSSPANAEDPVGAECRNDIVNVVKEYEYALRERYCVDLEWPSPKDPQYTVTTRPDWVRQLNVEFDLPDSCSADAYLHVEGHNPFQPGGDSIIVYCGR